MPCNSLVIDQLYTTLCPCGVCCVAGINKQCGSSLQISSDACSCLRCCLSCMLAPPHRLMGADHASRKALLGHDMVWSKPAADAQQQGSAGSSNPPAQAAAQQDSAGSSKSPEQAASQQDRAGSMRDFLRSTAAVRARRAAQQHGSPSSSKFPAQAPQDGAGSSNPPGLAPRTGSFLQRLAAGRAGSNKFAVESPAQKQTRLQYMLESAAPSTSPSTNPSTSPQHKPPAQPVVLMFDVCHLTAGGIFPATYAFERSMGFLAHALDAGVRVTKVVYIHDGRDPSKHPAPGMVVRDADLTCGLVKLIGEDGARWVRQRLLMLLPALFYTCLSLHAHALQILGFGMLSGFFSSRKQCYNRQHIPA